MGSEGGLIYGYLKELAELDVGLAAIEVEANGGARRVAAGGARRVKREGGRR